MSFNYKNNTLKITFQKKLKIIMKLMRLYKKNISVY